jgi:hypothetical protein
MRRRLSRFALLSLAMGSACSDLTSRGSPCGGERQVSATAVLPDTGLGAGGEATISFVESDAHRSLDETALIVWTFPPTNASFSGNPPRVRIVTDDGRVFLDVQSTTAYLGSWYARAPIPNTPLRDEIVAAFQNGRVTIEFSSGELTPKTTRVQPAITFAGRTPVVMCL